MSVMDSDGNLYATDGPVPLEDAERARAWQAELDAIVQREVAETRDRLNAARLRELTGRMS